MTAPVPDRLPAAAESAQVVISAAGLLAPFNDCGALSPLDVHSAAAAARLWGEDDQRVILAAALAVRGARFGHVCIRLSAQRGVMVVEGQDPEVIEGLPWPDPGEWEQAAADSPMVGGGAGEEPLVLEGGRLYLERYYRYEDRLVRLIRARAAAPAERLDPAVRRMLDLKLHGEEGGPPNLQKAAAVKALSGRLAVIVGGPGTGKTYTVAALLAALAHRPGLFPRTALCAPTGKAAARLGEEVQQFAASGDPKAAAALEGLEASTIHRLLGWTWDRGRFQRHEGNRLPHDLVIVDEMSMVSLPLAAKLMEAVRDDAALVLVGDPFQLESIEAGTVLADIAGPPAGGGGAPAGGGGGPAPPVAGRVQVLERLYRYEEESSIADFAEAVRRGDADRVMELLGGGLDGLKWVEDRSAPEFEPVWAGVAGRRRRMVELAHKAGEEAQVRELLGKAGVLCAHREGPGSVAQWQGDIEAALDERFPGLRYGGAWYPGRPVMITSNDYQLGLYNGDLGVAVRTREGLRVVFERGDRNSFPPGYLGEHGTAHAMTIHKSQGSQFGEVVVVLPPDDSRLLTRELLYTAVTRAEHSVTVIGGESVIRRAVENSVHRASGLGPKLWNPASALSRGPAPQ